MTAAMKCTECPQGSDGFAVIPGIGEAGEIRFYCASCVGGRQVRMRYWDGRDLEGGAGDSFSTLVFAFEDVGRMRREDLLAVLEWLDDVEVARALRGADLHLSRKIWSVMPLERAQRIREHLEAAASVEETRKAREFWVSVIKRL